MEAVLLNTLEGLLRRGAALLAARAPEIVANKIVTELERALDPPLPFRSESLKQARKLLPLMRRSHDESDWVTFPRPVGRTVFLAAARLFLGDKPEEWAVVGLGKVASRSYVKEVFIRRGTVGAVGLPVSVQAQIRGHLDDVDGAEIIHVHNHPPGVGREMKNLLLGRAPVTSDADREVQQAHAAVAAAAIAARGTMRKVRFFVVENGQVHHYRLPSKGPLRDEAETILRNLMGQL